MPRLIVTAGAGEGLERCRLFLEEKGPQVLRRAAHAIEQQLLRLEADPHIGRPCADVPHWRELIIAFGGSGYVALYRFVSTEDAVYILAFRHQKEAGY